MKNSSNQTKIHLSGYQARDLEVIDYQMMELEGSGLKFRGPFPETLETGGYFTSIGAAQTLGCFVDKPYPDLLAKDLDLERLNLGYGGAGPEFFAGQSALIERINQGKFLIIQAMSGRSQSNSYFDTGGLEYATRRSDGAKLGALEAWCQLLEGSPAIKGLPLGKVSRALARRLAQPRLKAAVKETREAWIESTRLLVSQVKVPTILFWFSKRSPDYPESLKTLKSLFSEFPHMIDEKTLNGAKEITDYYVECVSERGSPQPLFSRFTGEPTTVDPKNDRPDLAMGDPWTHNLYYPSPEMNEDGYKLLLPVCREILGKATS